MATGLVDLGPTMIMETKPAVICEMRLETAALMPLQGRIFAGSDRKPDLDQAS